MGPRLVDAGADLAVGSHPHWVQSVDVALAPYRMDATFTPRPLRGAAARALLVDVRSGG